MNNDDDQQQQQLSIAETIRAWLQLVRVPNLLTVPGDPIAGFLLAAGGAAGMGEPWLLASACAAALLFYMGGLILNDLADFTVDSRERPERPLPSRRIKTSAAATAGAALLALAMLCCLPLGATGIWIGVGIVHAVVGYNLGLKRLPVAGPLVMGLCRGLSLLLGAAAAPVGSFGFGPPVIIAACVLALFIAAVTQIARHETTPERIGRSWVLPAVVLIPGLLLLLWGGGDIRRSEVIAYLGATFYIWWMVIAIGRRISAGTNAPPLIGAMLGLLPVLQAAFCFRAGAEFTGLLIGALLLLLRPVNRMVRKRFYAS